MGANHTNQNQILSAPTNPMMGTTALNLKGHQTTKSGATAVNTVGPAVSSAAPNSHNATNTQPLQQQPNNNTGSVISNSSKGKSNNVLMQQPLSSVQTKVIQKQQSTTRFKSCDWFQKRIADRKYS